MPNGLLVARCARSFFELWAFFAGEAGLLGACSHFSDTLLGHTGKNHAHCCRSMPRFIIGESAINSVSPAGYFKTCRI